MDDILSLLTTQVLPHWPFVMVTVILSVVGHVVGRSVFTKERAYKKQQASAFYKFWESQSFWWWGRETLALHSILAGVIIGFFWHNPEGANPAWSHAADIGYFAGAGAISLFAWSIAKGLLKSRGINLTLPGETPSDPPPPAHSHKRDDEGNEP